MRGCFHLHHEPRLRVQPAHPQRRAVSRLCTACRVEARMWDTACSRAAAMNWEAAAWEGRARVKRKRKNFTVTRVKQRLTRRFSGTIPGRPSVRVPSALPVCRCRSRDLENLQATRRLARSGMLTRPVRYSLRQAGADPTADAKNVRAARGAKSCFCHGAHCQALAFGFLLELVL